jgi:hypothetical protein
LPYPLELAFRDCFYDRILRAIEREDSGLTDTDKKDEDIAPIVAYMKKAL